MGALVRPQRWARAGKGGGYAARRRGRFGVKHAMRHLVVGEGHGRGAYAAGAEPPLRGDNVLQNAPPVQVALGADEARLARQLVPAFGQAC